MKLKYRSSWTQGHDQRVKSSWPFWVVHHWRPSLQSRLQWQSSILSLALFSQHSKLELCATTVPWHSAAGGCPGPPTEEVAKVRDFHSQGTPDECGMSTSPWLEASLKLPELTPAPWLSWACLSPGLHTCWSAHLSLRFIEPFKMFPSQGFQSMLCLYYRGTCTNIHPEKIHAGGNNSLLIRKCTNTVSLFHHRLESREGSFS